MMDTLERFLLVATGDEMVGSLTSSHDAVRSFCVNDMSPFSFDGH